MINKITTIDYFVLLFFFGLIIAIGIYFAKFQKGAKEYFTGGNMIPWWVGGISLYMSSFSAWTFTGASGFVYYTGLFGVIYFATWSLSFLIGHRITAARWRRSRVISPVEYSSTRYNVTTQQMVGYVMILSGLLTRGITLTAVSKVTASILNVDLNLVITVTGIIILFYPLLGGLWAVTITDVMLFIILFVTTLIIMPLSIRAVGGVSAFIDNLPPLKLEYFYNGMQYDIHYLIAFTLVNIVASNWNAAQRYFSVQDEKNAKRVGLTCALLFITAPILFGIPPLAAHILWPDLSVVDFFKGTFKPEDLVYVGLVMKILPNGLIGFFMAAMLAATMSTIDTSFNVDSSIISRDLYGGLINRKATDKQIFLAGRIATVVLGLVTILTAIYYAKSSLGIFNLMVIFISLLAMPVGVPMAFGLVFKGLPRWSAASAMLLGLLTSSLTRFVLHWNIGPQLYATIFITFAALLIAEPLGKLLKKNRLATALTILAGFSLLFGFYHQFSANAMTQFNTLVLVSFGLVSAASLYLFAYLFARESAEDRMIVEKFFQNLAIPIDVVREVYGGGRRPMSTYPVVGVITMAVGFFIFMLPFFKMPKQDIPITLGMGLLLLIFGFLMYYLGSKSERNFKIALEKKLHKDEA
ncbi:MAG: sodium:solute symporter family transporter [Candidatus Zhuqueibacterota bacterium]